MDLVNHLQGRLLFAVPKKGRLRQTTLSLLEGADIQFRPRDRLDIALVKNLPIALIFLPVSDIPTFIGQGRVDLGITGWDQVKEYDAAVRVGFQTSVGLGDASGCEVVMELGFGSCALQVQVPEKGKYARSHDLIGGTIGTSFVHLTAEYFANLERERKVKPATSAQHLPSTKIIELSGSVEAACALGVADGVVDLVETGDTMRAAGLKSIDTVLECGAVLVKARTPSNPLMVGLITSRISGVIAAQEYSLCQYNIDRSRLHMATAVTPGKHAPTVTALDSDGWVTVSSMVRKKEIALVMDNLMRIGAQDILILKIRNTR